jgi:alpha/beta superfamily hydrolase
MHQPSRLRRSISAILIVLAVFAGGCFSSLPTNQPPVLDSFTDDVYPTPALASITREQREVRFVSEGVELAGELDLPLGEDLAPLVFIIHHSGPVTRDAYGYMAELLTEAGFAVFRFDKRGVGRSGGEYGCCEAEDALAAYQAAVTQAGFDRGRVLIVAQSIGATHLADRFAEFAAIHPPLGVVLLSSLLGPEQITAIAAPVHVIVSGSEEALAAISVDAVEAHRRAWLYGATYFVADHSEHTLFDITDGAIEWSDPGWVRRYHRGAMQSMVDWLKEAAQ